MNLSCSSRVIKYLMFVFNLIFVITGIIILAVGVSVKAYYYKYDTFLDEKYFSLPNLLIATGSIIFFVSFFGCYGALKENWLLLLIFSTLLVVIFIFELSAGIAGYVLRDKTASYLEDRLNTTLWQYNANEEYRKMWDVIQEEFECCGIHGPLDYAPVFTNSNLPISCCPQKFGTVGAFYCNSYEPPTVPTEATTVAPVTEISSSSTSISSTSTEAATTLSTDTSTTENSDPNITILPPTTERQSKSEVLTNQSANAAPAAAAPAAVVPAAAPAPAAVPASRKRRQAEDTTTVTTTTVAPTYFNSTSAPYPNGCETAFGDFVRDHAKEIGGCAMALAIIQLIGILFSCHLSRKLKNGYYST